MTVDIVDLVGLHLVMSRTSGKAEIKFLVAGVGWATAELIMTRFIPLWVRIVSMCKEVVEVKAFRCFRR